TYNGSRDAEGVQFYVDGKPWKLKALVDDLNQDFKVKEPLRIGGGGGPANRFRGTIRDVKIYNVALKPEEVAVVATRSSIAEIAGTPAAQRSKGQADKIAWYFLETHASDPIRLAWRQALDLRKEKEDFEDS